MPSLHDFTLQGIDGKELPMAFYKGKAVLIVNVASECGLTPQYAELQELYDDYKDNGLVVVGIPCNQFGGQEPGTEEQIQTFCKTRFNVTFPMSSKMEVNGENRHPLYQWLTSEGEDIQWNFEKFLVNGNGNIVKRFSPQTTPDSPDVIDSIKAVL